MRNIKLTLCITILTCNVFKDSSEESLEGDRCDAGNGEMGFCIEITYCVEAITAAMNGRPFNICSYDGLFPTVCCLESDFDVSPEQRNKHKDKEGCSSSAERTGLQRGQRAADQCLDYQRKLCLCTADGAVQPAEAQIISYGKNSNPGEFGNMALLGYGDDKTRQWSCGGSIISDRYILTAGHCISGKLGKVKMVALGVLARSDLEKEGLIFEVKRIIPHPEFKPPSKYNDIALLEVDREIPLTRSIQPACLDVDEMDDHQGATATGWGALEYGEDNADILQKTKLYRFSDEECAAKYSEGRLLRSGINHSTQVCYGHRSHPADTCQGDSGGPLLIRNKFRCLHSIIGVTSFGSTCGMAGEPGVYTKLSSYLPWIESIVWP